MNTLEKAARLALEAFEKMPFMNDDRVSNAAAALRQALEQQPATSITIRYDLSPAMIESEIRDKLIELGWTPPDEKPALRIHSWNCVCGRIMTVEQPAEEKNT